jgi:hypothetical protein
MGDMMDDIQDPRLLYAKAALFLVAGGMATVQVWLMVPDPGVLALHLLSVWCFARAYYFAFYVVEHYVDGDFRFRGIGDFLLYLLRRRGGGPGPEA